MLGLLLIYFIWKYYSELAVTNNKSKWYGLLGIASYYIGTFIGGFVVAMVSILLSGSNAIDEMNDFVLALIALPFGLLSVWGLYIILKKRWSNTDEHSNSDSNSLDGHLIEADLKD